jgi:protein-tyrosine phosphatase
MLKRQKLARRKRSLSVDSGGSREDRDWVFTDDVDLIAATVEDFRGQRPSMVQNLRQFVLCYESVLEWLVNRDDK